MIRNVTVDGATGDGVTNDGAAIRTTISTVSGGGGGDVVLSQGTYIVDRDGGTNQCLSVPDNVRLLAADGSAVTIKAISGLADNIDVVRMTGANCELDGIVIDGNKDGNSTNEQRHGIVFEACTNAVVRAVRIVNCTGDAAYVYQNVDGVTFDNCIMTGCERNGLSVAPTTGTYAKNISLTQCRISGNAAQQVDIEPGAAAGTVDGVMLSGCVLDGAGVSNDYVVAISGQLTGGESNTRNVSISNCTLNGGVNITWAEQVALSGNVGSNPTNKSCVYVYRGCRNVVVNGNSLYQSQDSVSHIPIVTVNGAGSDAPSAIVITNNALRAKRAATQGISSDGALSVIIKDNHIQGANTSAGASWGINIRTTSATAIRLSVVAGNYIVGWGEAGIRYAGVSTSTKHLVAMCRDNVIEDGSNRLAYGIVLDGDVRLNCIDTLLLANNVIVGGSVTFVPIFNYPTGSNIVTPMTTTLLDDGSGDLVMGDVAAVQIKEGTAKAEIFGGSASSANTRKRFRP
ncbi:MAG: hypothetical protein E6Q97_38425 [Desulfurellales bacterium]|nr:MAG: hypothetical protein E6Q97_38425 [Desulfurellales bacterium]